MYFIGLSVLVVFFVILNLLLGQLNPDVDKLSAYECGFDTLGDARVKFDLFFYLIALLFLVFDLELILLFPIIGSFIHFDSIYPLIVIFMFIIIVTIGYAYEWITGAIKY